MILPRFSTGLLLAVYFVVFVLFPGGVSLVTDWWWFSEVGYRHVFIKSLFVKTTLAFALGAACFVFLLANFSFAMRSKFSWMLALPEAWFGRPVHLDRLRLKQLSVLCSLVCALFFGLVAAANWQEVLRYVSRTPMGAADPVFHKDIGFYLFSFPVFQTGVGIMSALSLLSLTTCALIYFLRGCFYFPVQKTLKHMQIERPARMHLGLLLVFFLSTVALGTYLSFFKLLLNQTGPVFGAVYTDAAVKIPILYASLGTALLALVSAAVWAFSGKISPLLLTASLYILTGLAGALIPSVVQKLIVGPNELVKETPFIKRNIAATRSGFALDTIQKREISGDKPITAEDIAANNLTIKNVRLWDRQPLLSTFSQIQEIRTYYKFAEVDNDRYIIDGEIRQIMLSPRELSSESLPNRSWINERLTFTHGYGVAAGPVNQVTPEGLPVLFVKDLPPQSDVKELKLTRPEIYFGELSNDHVITRTKSREFDYPKGEENVYTTYKGKGGVEINSLVRRVFYALKFKSLKLLLSNDVTRESRILYHRRISERVAKIAPFLTLDRDPYIVIADGRIYWLVDAYTASGSYPYSQPVRFGGRNINYIRNSVKVVVDAYDGSVVFYQADTKDPIIRTYAKIFPGMFRPLSQMPKALLAHLRYPEDIFTLQTAVYTVYHMDDPQIFYNKEDQWEIPAIALEGESASAGGIPAMQPRHIIMKLPGDQPAGQAGKKEEYILMLPFTPRSKDNLSAWMVARSDGKSYGTLMVYRFPKDKLVFGPKQVIGRINQDPEISRQISLWDQRGSEVIQGPLLVIPVEESLLYVRPLYIKAAAGKIPELKRVIVAYENKVAMEERLEEGLRRIFGSKEKEKPPQTAKAEPPAPSKPETRTIEDVLSRALEAYEEALTAQKDGDWARYGEAIKRLGKILKP